MLLAKLKAPSGKRDKTQKPVGESIAPVMSLLALMSSLKAKKKMLLQKWYRKVEKTLKMLNINVEFSQRKFFQTDQKRRLGIH